MTTTDAPSELAPAAVNARGVVYGGRMATPGRYVERLPRGALTGVASSAYTQQGSADGRTSSRHIPNGCVEVRCEPGRAPRVVGPLTRARTEILERGGQVIGLRLRPGAAPALLGLPASALLDEEVELRELWGSGAERLAEAIATAGSGALGALERALEQRLRAAPPPDPLVLAAVHDLMPWRGGEIADVAVRLSISESQLRRRTRAAVGMSPKVLQRMLRFQGFLALVQAAIARGASPREQGIAALAAEVGYADQSHLHRECLQFTGTTPADFIAETMAVCSCGHDHAASFRPVLSARRAA
jgi:AraC-like DNA-binding protein